MTTEPMTITEFRSYLCAQINRDPETIPLDADLRREADLDSIEMFLLVVAAEDLGAYFPEEMLAQVVTLQDAYHHVVTQAGHRP
jgi:acyl carrier protein